MFAAGTGTVVAGHASASTSVNAAAHRTRRL